MQAEGINVNYRGYEIANSNSQGGKAGRGRNKTATLQVRDHNAVRDGYLLMGEFRYKVGDQESLARAEQKARERIDMLILPHD